MDALIILYYYWQAKQRDHIKNKVVLTALQEKLYRKLQQQVLSRSSFYSKMAHLSLNEMPIMTKKMMMEKFDELNTQQLSKSELMKIALRAEDSRDFTPMINDITVGLSSGTSGNRGLFIVNRQERLKWVGYLLAKILPEGILQSCKIAFFLRANSNLYSSIEKRRGIQFKYFDLLIPYAEHIQSLQAYQPDLIIGPAQLLKLLAHSQREDQLAIHPKKIISVAEVLEDHVEQLIANSFGTPVHQVYQCTEGFLGATCEKGTLHINEEWIHIEKEWLDKEKTRFVPIITDLIRGSQPIIRYRLDDVLHVKKDGCSCGRVSMAIEKVEGRCDEILLLPSIADHQLIQVFPDFISRAIINADADIDNYAVRQIDVSAWEIYVDRISQAVTNKIADNIMKLCHKLNVLTPQFTFKPYMEQPLIEKRKRISRLITQEGSVVHE